MEGLSGEREIDASKSRGQLRLRNPFSPAPPLTAILHTSGMTMVLFDFA